MGRFRPGSNQRNQWNYYFGGEERNWFGEPELAVNLLADALAAEFAVSGSAPLESVDCPEVPAETGETFSCEATEPNGNTVNVEGEITEVDSESDQVNFTVRVVP